MTYWASAAANEHSRSVAVRKGVADMADDLHMEWYLSLRTTLDRLRDRDGSMPEWLDDEQAALRYSLRALNNDANDLGAARSRAPHTFSDISRDDITPFEVADPRVDVAASVTTEPHDVLLSIAGELSGMLVTGEGGCPGCTATNTVRICMGVVERLRWSADPEGAAAGLRGGTTDWDRRLYDVMIEVAPDRMSVGSDNRMKASARKFKERCGACAELLLRKLLAVHVFGGAQQ